MLPLGKVFQDNLCVIADGCQANSLIFEPFCCLLQLNQLRFAIGSPIGGTKKQQNHPVFTGNCLIGLLMTELIGCLKRRCYLAFCDSNLLHCLIRLPWTASAIRLRDVGYNDQ